jgi:hypothetical protein
VSIKGTHTTAEIVVGQTGGGDIQLEQVPVTNLLTFAAKVGTVPTYVSMDVQYWDTEVIRALQLNQTANQRAFPVLQFEVDAPSDATIKETEARWSYLETTVWLDAHGYDLFYVGKTYWWKINPSFLIRGYGSVNTHGRCNTNMKTSKIMFAWTNILAAHREYAHPFIRKTLLDSATKHAAHTRASVSEV